MIKAGTLALLAVVTGLICGCAGQLAFQEAEELAARGEYDAAVIRYQDAVAEDPDKDEYRLRLQNTLADAAMVHMERGGKLLEEEKYREAALELSLAVELDPSLEAARQKQKQAETLLRARELVTEAETFLQSRRLPQAKHNLDQALILNPGDKRAQALIETLRQKDRPTIDGFELAVNSAEPITLDFRETEIKDAFRILTKLSGINFIFDEEIRSQRINLHLEEATFAQALELLLRLNGLGKKVLNEKTLILYPKSREKEKQYEDLIIQTFYLSNIDAKKAVNLLRTMLQLRKIYVHEELNALVIRDRPDVIELARQILEAADRADAEVVFDLELVEISHGNDLLLGPKLSTYSVSLGFGEGPDAQNIVSSGLSPGDDTTKLVRSASSLESFYTLPTATFDFAKSLTDSEILANPKIRVKNKDKAKVHIGQREPVITVSINGDNRTDNVQYIDVGVKLDVEPTIQLDDSVVTKLSLEVSSVSDRQTTESGTQVLTITTTNAQTVLTLKDGERTIIGGLIRDDLSTARRTVPFFGDLPLIGNLFSHHDRNKQKREILLSITPHIMKILDLPRADVATIWSGGEDDLKAGLNFGSFAEGFVPESEQTPASPVPAMNTATESAQPAGQPGFAVFPELPVPGPLGPAGTPPGTVLVAPVEEGSAPAAENPVELQEGAPAASGLGAPENVPRESIESREIQGHRRPAVMISGPSAVAVGSEFTLDVQTAEIENLYSAPMLINFDAERLEYIRAREGDFLKEGGTATVFTVSGGGAEGRLVVGYKRQKPGTGASGSGPLFHVTFRAKAPGRTSVGIGQVNFQDAEGRRVPVTPGGLDLEVR